MATLHILIAFVETGAVSNRSNKEVLAKFDITTNSGKGMRVLRAIHILFPRKIWHAAIPFGINGSSAPVSNVQQHH